MTNLGIYLDIVEKCRIDKAKRITKTFGFWTKTLEVFDKIREKHGSNRLSPIHTLDYNGLTETQTSDLIKNILAFKYQGDYPVWRSFVSFFYPEIETELIKHPVFTAEKERIDICVKEKGKYAFIFENKLKGAVFQRNQLGRYVQKMCDEKYAPEQIYVIILPRWIDYNFISRIRKSAWNAPIDWNKNNNDRKCCDFESKDPYACWCDSDNWLVEHCKWCQRCVNHRKTFHKLDNHIKVIDAEFPQWLIDTASDEDYVPSHEILVRSAMVQLGDYIKGLYQIRYNKLEIMENIKVLSKEFALEGNNPEDNYAKVSKSLEELNVLQRSMETLKTICRMRVWQKEIEEQFPDACVDTDDMSFGILINGVYCGIWIDINDTNKRLFWGFNHNHDTIMADGVKDMVQQIVSKASIYNKESNEHFFSWYWTNNGAERIATFLRVAKELGFQYKKK